MLDLLNHFRECELRLANIRAESVAEVREAAEKLLAPTMQIVEALLEDEDIDKGVLQDTLTDLRKRIKSLEEGDYTKAIYPEIPPPDSGVRDTDPAPESYETAPDTLRSSGDYWDDEDGWFT